jgi:inner membrane protein YidH
MIPRFSDHAANERTYLAWVRTAITVMAFGFLLERFDIFLAYASHATGAAMPRLHVRASEWLGLALLAFGALLVLLATVSFHRNRAAIDREGTELYRNAGMERVLSGMLIAMAVFLVVYVAQQVVALG